MRWQACLEAVDSLSVCTDAQQFFETASQHRDALILLHVGFPQLANPELVSAFTRNHTEMRVIICSDVPNDDEGLSFLKAGVFGYCNTWIAEKQLRRVVEQVTADEVWVGRALILKLINNLSHVSQADSSTMANDWLKGLTQREREVAERVGQGASNKLIARDMDITERTVKAHLSAIFRKTGCKDRIQLALQINQTQPESYSKLGS